MPSLNCKTRKLSYTASDARCVAACINLLTAMQEFDDDAEEASGEALAALHDVSGHISKARVAASKPVKSAESAVK